MSNLDDELRGGEDALGDGEHHRRPDELETLSINPGDDGYDDALESDDDLDGFRVDDSEPDSI